MESMDKAFLWIIEQSKGEQKELWKYYYGAWLAGTDQNEKSIKELSNCKAGISKPLLARLLKLKGNLKDAIEAYRSIQERWLQIHPQIIVERDKLLKAIGPQTIDEREYWLDQVAALKDEWILE